MKKQCDEKRFAVFWFWDKIFSLRKFIILWILCTAFRDAYEYMLAQQRERGKSKSGKGENFALQQLQSAREQYEEEADLCFFRLKSLKQGQSRNLLTQAARHHMAQVYLASWFYSCFFFPLADWILISALFFPIRCSWTFSVRDWNHLRRLILLLKGLQKSSALITNSVKLQLIQKIERMIVEMATIIKKMEK